MKKISAILLILIAFTLNSCENKIRLESIVNTTWRASIDDENYIEYSFYSNEKGQQAIGDMGERMTMPTEYKISSSGYLKVRTALAEGFEGDWEYGQFDADEGTLEIDGIFYDLIAY